MPKFNTGHIASAFDAAGFVPQQTTNARYFRVWCQMAMATQVGMGEIIWGRSVWLKGNPLMSWDDKNERSSVSAFEARNGEVTNYINYSGQKLRRFRYKTNDAEEIEALDRLWKHTAYGAGSFLFEQPSNLEDNSEKPSLYRYSEPSRAFPISWGADGRDWELEFLEVPPYMAEGDR